MNVSQVRAGQLRDFASQLKRGGMLIPRTFLPKHHGFGAVAAKALVHLCYPLRHAPNLDPVMTAPATYLREAYLRGADLSGANLRGAKL